MNKQIINWLLFLLLAFIWGSSFILMKEGMKSLSSFQVASLRILAAGVVLLPLTLKHIRSIPRNKFFMVFLSGILGSLLPAYLFCAAETRIDSALAGMLNALTPIFAIVCGSIFFSYKVPRTKIAGIIVGFSGSILLLLSQGIKGNADIIFIFYAIVATLLYGININMVHKYLAGIRSLRIASVALSICAIPALLVLIISGFFNLPLQSGPFIKSMGASILLGIGGTAIATVLFYMLVKRAGVIFSSMVTYGIPFIAILWGILSMEHITWLEVASLAVILSGVYIANSAPKTVAVPD